MEQPKSAHDHYEQGRVLKHALMYDQAREEFQHAASHPQYAGNAHVQIALCLRATGRYDEAVEAFRQALELGTFSSKDKAHILYFLGQTLESLGRYAEALEAYGWTRKEVPGFQDVAQRIKHLLAGGRALLPQRRPASRSAVGDMLRLGGQLTPQVLSLLGQAWTSFGQYADRLGHHRVDQKQSPSYETWATRVESESSRRRDAVHRHPGIGRETHVGTFASLSDCRATFHQRGGRWPVKESCETSPLGAVASRV
jgi:tetratricopeptide (TPR) repeat protein